MSSQVVGSRSGDVLRFAYGDLVRVDAPRSEHHGHVAAVIDVAGTGVERRWLVVLDTCRELWLADAALVSHDALAAV